MCVCVVSTDEIDDERESAGRYNVRAFSQSSISPYMANVVVRASCCRWILSSYAAICAAVDQYAIISIVDDPHAKCCCLVVYISAILQ